MCEEIFDDFVRDRNLSSSSISAYRACLYNFSDFHEMKLKDLIDEADYEEEAKIRAKNRKIVKRLKGYRNHMIDENMSVNTIIDYFTKIKTFYRHNGIEVPYIPSAKLKEKYHERFDDIPSRKEIKQAIDSTKNLKHKAIILFMSSSGTAITETINIKIKDFIKATQEYHHSKDIQGVIEELENKKDIVPLFEMVRQKTNYPYYTCCSPEAIQMIIKYLKTRPKIDNNDRLFEIKQKSLVSAFKRINDINKWGKIGHNRFFHSHSLRKFQATVIEEESLVNKLQGRKSNPIKEAYFKNNPNRIKQEYIKHLHKLTINKTETYTIESKEYKKIKKELEKNKKELKSKENKQNELEKRLAKQEEQNKKILEMLNERQGK